MRIHVYISRRSHDVDRVADTPPPPYYAAIFSSVRTAQDDKGYETMADRMVELAAQQPGFLGVESARNSVGITVSYWRDLESIRAWKANAEHKGARLTGRAVWYEQFFVRIALVERDYSFDRPSETSADTELNA